jgi:hypothetical protein
LQADAGRAAADSAKAMTAFPALTLVNYADVRDQIQHGDILLASGQYEFSKLIQIATASPWSHVAFILRLDIIDKVMVLESIEGTGVRTIPLSKYVTDFEGTGCGYKGRIAIARHKQFASLATPEKLRAMASFATDRMGYHYSDESIANITKRIVASAMGLPVPAPVPHQEDICSEYWDRVMQYFGIKVKWDKRGFIAPDDIAVDDGVELLWELEVSQQEPA